MAESLPLAPAQASAPVDEVQIFDTGVALEGLGSAERGQPARLDMATSPNCDIAVFRVPAHGETRLDAIQGADLILLLLEGECLVSGGARPYALKSHQGVLVAAGVSRHFVNRTDDDLVFLSLRTESVEDRPGYVPTKPSGVKVRVPVAHLSAKGLGRSVYVYIADQRTIRIAAFSTLQWARSSLTRLYCEYERAGRDILVNLPERVVRWYGIRDLTESDYRIIPDPEGASARIDLSPMIERQARNR